MKHLMLIALMVLTTLCKAQVMINEIQSSNTATISDNFGQYDDWIEIYNPSDTPVDIGGMVLKDNVDTWQIPTGDPSTIVAAKGFFLLWADDEAVQGKFHTNFKLSAANGEFLGLFESDSVTVIDTVNFPPLTDDQSYGRCDHGNWTIFDNATALSPNNCSNTGLNNVNNTGLTIHHSTSMGTVTIVLPEYNGEEVNLLCYSIGGALLMNKQYHNNTFTFDASCLNRGIYIINLFTGKACYSEKIVIE